MSNEPSRAAVRAAMREWRCARCKRRPRNVTDARQWNMTLINGRMVNELCPDCQSPDETAEAQYNWAKNGGNYRQHARAYMFTGGEFRHACQHAIETGGMAPSDEYLDEYDKTDHLVMLAGATTTDGLGMAFPFPGPATEFVHDSDGNECPLVSAADLFAGPHVVVEIPLAEALTAPQAFVRESWFQATVAKTVESYIFDAASAS